MLLILGFAHEDWLLLIAAFPTSGRSLSDEASPPGAFRLDACARCRCVKFRMPTRGCGFNSFGNRLITVITAQAAHSYAGMLGFFFRPLFQFLWVTSTSHAPAPSSGSGGRLRCTALSWCRRTWAAGPWTNTTPSTSAAVRAASLCASQTL